MADVEVTYILGLEQGGVETPSHNKNRLSGYYRC